MTSASWVHGIFKSRNVDGADVAFYSIKIHTNKTHLFIY